MDERHGPRRLCGRWSFCWPFLRRQKQRFVRRLRGSTRDSAHHAPAPTLPHSPFPLRRSNRPPRHRFRAAAPPRLPARPGRRERGSLCGRWFFLRVAGPARLPPAQPAFPGTPRPERRSPGKELHNPLDKRSRLGLFFFFFYPPPLFAGL